MFELVIFDCDGVLVDSEPISNRVLAECLTEIGLPTTPQESIQTYMGRWWPDILAIAAERLGGPVPGHFTDTYKTRQLEALAAGVGPVAGVLEALDRIQTPACVASNGTVAKMERTLGRAGLLDRFRGRLFSAYDVDRGKPAPDLYLHAAAAMGVDAHVCAVVEDTVLGVEGARAAGMEVFAFFGHDYDPPFGPAELEAAGGRVFAAMEELPALLSANRGD